MPAAAMSTPAQTAIFPTLLSGATLGSGGAERGRWHNLVDLATAYVVNEAGDDQLVRRSGRFAESLDVVRYV